MKNGIDDPKVGEEAANANSPEMDESGKVTRKALTSGKQALAVAQALKKGNEDRTKLNATIVKKYTGGQPYDPKDLQNALEDWRSNAPTGFMSGIVDRIIPTFIKAIESAAHLTNASLCGKYEEADKKSSWFKVNVTKTIKEWDGFRDFLSSLWQENVLIGYVAPLNLNPYSPWPKVFRGDEVFFPEGIGQQARSVPVLAADEDLLISDFADNLKDGPEISAHAGWKFQECIDAINKALPKASSTSGDQDARKWEDAITEANVGAAHSGAKVVKLSHTLAVEPDSKKVTHFIVNREGGDTLFHKEERFEKIEDVLTLFTLQPGSGKYYSSKGVARMLLNLHIATERMRNGMLDNPFIANLKILKTAPNSVQNLELKMSSPLMVVSADGEFEQDGIRANVDEFIQADNQISRWAQNSVGTYVSGLDSAEDRPSRTAREAVIDANRDAQAQTASIARGLGQFANQIAQITRRLFDPETTDEAAKKLQERAKDPEDGNLNEDEIKELVASPPAAIAQDVTQIQNEQIVRVYEILANNPNVDQDILLEKFLSASVNPQFAKDVQLTKQGLQANEAEAIRQQMMETEAILAGAPGMPVSPRDIHPVHLKTAFSDLKAGLPNVIKIAPQKPEVLDHMNTQLVHTGAHIQQMQEQGAKPEEIKPFVDAQKAFEQVLQQIGEQLKSQKESQQPPEGDLNESTQAPARPDAQGVSMQGPAEQNAPTEPEPTVGGMDRDILKAWIGKYTDLPITARAALEKISGLDAAEATLPYGEQIHPIDPAMFGGMPPTDSQMQPPPPEQIEPIQQQESAEIPVAPTEEMGAELPPA